MKDIFEEFSEQSAALGRCLEHHGVLLSTAESCTGGLVSGIITATPGSSQWFDRGFVTYSNDAKMAMLDVSATTLEKHGAVSEEVAIQMAEGVLFKVPTSDIAVSVTGVAGPGGGTEAKPVGMVCFALAKRAPEGIVTLPFTRYFEGDRAEVRLQSCYFIIDQLIQVLGPLNAE